MVEGFGESKNIWVVSRDNFMDMGGPYIEGVGCDKAVGWTGIWFDISGQEEKEGSTEDGA